VILEGIGTSDVADDSSGVPVPALIHDAHEIGATLGRGGDIAGPQAVSPESRGIVSGRLRAALDEVGDGSVVPSTIRITRTMELLSAEVPLQRAAGKQGRSRAAASQNSTAGPSRRAALSTYQYTVGNHT
jgi:hypothetical protein